MSNSSRMNVAVVSDNPGTFATTPSTWLRCTLRSRCNSFASIPSPASDSDRCASSTKVATALAGASGSCSNRLARPRRANVSIPPGRRYLSRARPVLVVRVLVCHPSVEDEISRERLDGAVGIGFGGWLTPRQRLEDLLRAVSRSASNRSITPLIVRNRALVAGDHRAKKLGAKYPIPPERHNIARDGAALPVPHRELHVSARRTNKGSELAHDLLCPVLALSMASGRWPNHWFEEPIPLAIRPATGFPNPLLGVAPEHLGVDDLPVRDVDDPELGWHRPQRTKHYRQFICGARGTSTVRDR
jgi:hypothetical protein